MIFAMHGVIQSRSERLLVHRWMLDAEQFESFLSRRSPFVSLKQALQGRGDALTIDDATRAAYDAALLAKNHGHDVTMFLNSKNVSNATPYYLHVLSAILDNAHSAQITCLSKKYIPAKPSADRSQIREFLKYRLSRLCRENALQDTLSQLAAELGFNVPTLPAYLHTLSFEQVAQLHDIGVRLENHGASHVDFSILRDDDIQDEIIECRKWLLSLLSVDSRYFAVPFGNLLPRFDLSDDLAHCWFTENKALHPGFVGPKVYNRKALRY